ncbi:MAG: hypothetical protein AMS27_05195 [Bacteroides sp. SM23_62_1]|nr:MAG: hypothetical protein AMS27_05195 [Bacteroides sp. SM23_62_1]
MFAFMIPALLLASALFAQPGEDEELSPKDRFFFGGNFSLMFGYITNVEVSPLVGYYIAPRLAAGAGVRFEFYKDKGYYYPYQTTIYGGNIFTRYLLIKNLGEGMIIGLNTGIFAQVEYELLSLEKEYFEPPYTEDGRFLDHAVLVGGGITQPVGRRSAFLITVLYNLNEGIRSPYSNPIIRVGFVF